MHSGTCSAGGGTKAALPGRVPPIQFWLRRNSPGIWLLPRPLASNTPYFSYPKFMVFSQKNAIFGAF
jgi:hypothetical protein